MKNLSLVRCLVALVLVFLLAGDTFAGPVRRVIRHHRERITDRVEARRAGATAAPACACPGCGGAKPAPAPQQGCPGGKCPLKGKN